MKKKSKIDKQNKILAKLLEAKWVKVSVVENGKESERLFLCKNLKIK